ncbi:hypothetical protein FEM48_Zijuj11G0075200 [Ziziphus jujuba var. spinosa]|uniref:Receptor-like protein EIX2 n=1 Tax=Ziziphus jujuba var. spinosa TaxID=714518 RepID=A0A978UHM7_ZIZJJ|nr:hypothetical protein FEM48_Zijuj11G0075200 [Ziziphus jujuba var. spinosa]
MNSLVYLDLSYNRFVHPFPNSCCWNSTSLRGLKVAYNQMNSSLAIWLSGLSSLVALDLSGNSLQGPLPSSNRNSTALRYHELGACELNSTIFSGFLYDLGRLEYLGLNRNNIEGVISSAFQNLTSLVHLKMSGHSLEGEIPTFMGNLASLVYLDLSYNSLEGEIPSSLGNLTSIVRLYFVNNSLEGEIPSTLANLCNLEEIDLSDNKFGGKVLNAFDSLSSGCLSNSLRSIDLSGNSFSALQVLDVGRNQLNGSLPESLSGLSNLYGLDITWNHLEGVVTQLHFANLTSLSVLIASGNSLNLRLTGRIPDILHIDSSCLTIDMSSNMFNGKIPLSTQLQSFDTSSFIGNELCEQSLYNICDEDQSKPTINSGEQKADDGDEVGRWFHLGIGTGKIPSSTQLQSFDASSFIGNELCGPPISKNCEKDQTIPAPSHGGQKADGGDEVSRWFHLGIVTGFAVGFFGVIAPLLFSTTWRNACFGFFGNVWYKILCRYRLL